jgi:hypothetical protein
MAARLVDFTEHRVNRGGFAAAARTRQQDRALFERELLADGAQGFPRHTKAFEAQEAGLVSGRRATTLSP